LQGLGSDISLDTPSPVLRSSFALIKQTQSWNNLNQIAKAINSNTWMVSPESEKALQEACKAIIEIRPC
jgi:hypothetical protein